MCRPFRAQIIVMYYPGRCPGLVCIALSGQKNAPFFRMRPMHTFGSDLKPLADKSVKKKFKISKIQMDTSNLRKGIYF